MMSLAEGQRPGRAKPWRRHLHSALFHSSQFPRDGTPQKLGTGHAVSIPALQGSANDACLTSRPSTRLNGQGAVDKKALDVAAACSDGHGITVFRPTPPNVRFGWVGRRQCYLTHKISIAAVSTAPRQCRLIGRSVTPISSRQHRFAARPALQRQAINFFTRPLPMCRPAPCTS